jgi:hypothetical protein
MLTELVDNLDVIFYTEPDSIPIEDDGVRSVDVKFRQEIIDRYEQLFKENYFWQDKVVRLYGSVEERMETILNKIDESTNIRQQQNNKALRTNVGV